MTRMTTDVITGALVAALDALEDEDWGDEDASLFIVADAAEGCAIVGLATLEMDIDEAVDALIEGGFGMGSEPRIVGVVLLSEAWRALDDDELRAVLPSAGILGTMGDAVDWHEYCEYFRSRADLSMLPDRLRHEVRIALCVTREGSLVQVVRDRGASASTIDARPFGDESDGGRVAQALRRLLATPGVIALP